MRYVHGKAGTGIYNTWILMKGRCYATQSRDYPQYGGRGIKVCDRWLNSLDAFHADMGDKPDGMTLDRIDTNGDYEPGNCRWATPTEQARNRRTNVYVEYRGNVMLVQEAAELAGIPYKLATARIAHGISLDLPRNRTFKHVSREKAEQIESMIAAGMRAAEIASEHGVSVATVYRTKTKVLGRTHK